MARALTPIAVILAAFAFAYAVPLTVLFNALQPMTVVGSIFAAAVLVRLNRGMPTLDWKGVEASKRADLGERFVSLTVQYATFLGVLGLTIAVLVVVVAIGPAWFSFGRAAVGAQVVSGVIGGLTALCLLRMGYVVWRDLDIVRLQATVIGEAGTAEAAAEENKAATNKVANIRASVVRGGGNTAPKAWDE